MRECEFSMSFVSLFYLLVCVRHCDMTTRERRLYKPPTLIELQHLLIHSVAASTETWPFTGPAFYCSAKETILYLGGMGIICHLF
jgi:hypothetical protein